MNNKAKNVNILHKLYSRQLCGKATENCRLREPELSLCEPRNPWYYVPLKNIVDEHKALLRGHVLLGFLKDGIHLISYLCQVESSEVDILHSFYSYTLYIWRFDMGSPLKKVCTYPLFSGETITSDLLLVICEAAENDRLVVLGAAARPEETSTSRQRYLSIFPAPSTIHQLGTHTDAFFVHFKYDVQPPYPPFSPLISLRFKDSVICNTGDSMTILKMQTHDSVLLTPDPAPSIPRSPAPSYSTASHSSEGESDVSDLPSQDYKRTKYQCSCPFLRSSEHLASCIVGRMDTVHVATECDPFSPLIHHKRRRFRSKKSLSSQSPKIVGEKKNLQVDSVTTFSQRLFGLSQYSAVYGRTRYDATQTLYPVLSTSLIHGNLRTTFTRVSESPVPAKPPLPDDYMTITQASFDAELYINSVVGHHEGLAARYLSLRDYDMRLLDVCEDSNSVLILIMVQCLASGETTPHKQMLLSSGFVLNWNVESGAAKTLEYLPIEEFDRNPCSVKSWCPGAKFAQQLRNKWFIRSAYNKSVRAFSNASVFSGNSLTKLSHPYLPVAIIL